MPRKYTKKKKEVEIFNEVHKELVEKLVNLEPVLSEKTPEAPIYEITIQLGNEIYKGQGATAYEALKSIQKPTKITTKAIVSMTDGEKSMQKFFTAFNSKRLFYPLAQFTQARNLTALLKWTSLPTKKT